MVGKQEMCTDIVTEEEQGTGETLDEREQQSGKSSEIWVSV